MPAKMPTSANLPLLLTLVASAFVVVRLNFVSALPTAVALGGAVVAAVEEDANAQGLQQSQRNFDNFANTSEFNGFVELQNVPAAERRIDKFDEARGKHHKKHKKMNKLYPLFIGTVLAKTILVPLILKMLTAISTSSFIMAKIALAASGLLALKWAFAGSGRERSHVEVVHVPLRGGGGGGGGLGYNTLDWSDLSWSGSNYVDVKTTPKQHLKYIPLKGGSGGSSVASSSTFLHGSYPSNKVSGTASSGYRYNYDKNLDGKPFL